MEASAAGRLDAINSLVGFAKMQADGLEKMINFVDLKKRTALDLARNGGHTECAKVLEANGGVG
jgi:hypothetical protein